MLKGCGFHSWSGNRPRLQVQTQVWVLLGCGGRQPIYFSSFLSKIYFLKICQGSLPGKYPGDNVSSLLGAQGPCMALSLEFPVLSLTVLRDCWSPVGFLAKVSASLAHWDSPVQLCSLDTLAGALRAGPGSTPALQCEPAPGTSPSFSKPHL